MTASTRPRATAVALVLTSLALALGLVELGLRLFVPPRIGTEMRALHQLRPDRPWLYEMRPGARVLSADGIDYAVNADGYRGPVVPRVKPPDTFRVLVLGDSVSFGWGVAEGDAYPALLAPLLSTRGRPAVEIVNLGVSGYNPYTEAALFAGRGVEWRPDLVLVQFCVNDLNDPTMHFDASTSMALGSLPDAAFPDPTTPRRPPARPSLGCPGLRLCQLLDDVLFAPPAADPDALRAALVARENPSERDLAWLESRYREIDAAAARIGARVALVVFPYASQLDDDASSALQTGLRTVAERLGWLAIDVLPALRASAAPATGLFLDPWHPTAAGHVVVARAIARRLRCAGTIPGAPPIDCGAR